MNLPADKMAVNNTVASYGLINLQSTIWIKTYNPAHMVWEEIK